LGYRVESELMVVVVRVMDSRRVKYLSPPRKPALVVVVPPLLPLDVYLLAVLAVTLWAGKTTQPAAFINGA
jgi:hypothetical protein